VTERSISTKSLLSALIVAMVTACGPVEVVVPLPAHTYGTEIDSDAFDGVLRLDQPCLYLAGDGVDLNLLWPAGYSLRGSPPVVTRADGAGIAKVGDALVIGGLPTNGHIAPPGCPSREGILVGAIAAVNGVEVVPALTRAPPPTGQPTVRPKPR